MCDLLAMSFNKPVAASFFLRNFEVKERFNPHGWGAAWYHGRTVHVVKEPVRASESSFFAAMLRSVEARSEVFIAHIRRSSSLRLAPPSYMNTQPFWRELGGRAYVFAHNGSLKPGVKRAEFKRRFPLGKFKPAGGTGSEYVFCYLLDCIEEEAGSWGRGEFKWLAEKLAELNEHAFLNCALSDGDHLFLYHDSEGLNGMALTSVKARFPVLHLTGDQREVVVWEEDKKLHGFVAVTLSLKYSPTPVYVADGEWVHVKPGELLVFKNGEKHVSITAPSNY